MFRWSADGSHPEKKDEPLSFNVMGNTPIFGKVSMVVYSTHCRGRQTSGPFMGPIAPPNAIWMISWPQQTPVIFCLGQVSAVFVKNSLILSTQGISSALASAVPPPVRTIRLYRPGSGYVWASMGSKKSICVPGRAALIDLLNAALKEGSSADLLLTSTATRKGVGTFIL